MLRLLYILLHARKAYEVTYLVLCYACSYICPLRLNSWRRIHESFHLYGIFHFYAFSERQFPT